MLLIAARWPGEQRAAREAQMPVPPARTSDQRADLAAARDFLRDRLEVLKAAEAHGADAATLADVRSQCEWARRRVATLASAS
jgi:hypothetical protein